MKQARKTKRPVVEPLIPSSEKTVVRKSSMRCLECAVGSMTMGTGSMSEASAHAGMTGHRVTAQLSITTEYAPSAATVQKVNDRAKGSGRGGLRRHVGPVTDEEIKVAVIRCLDEAAARDEMMTSKNDIQKHVVGSRSNVLRVLGEMIDNDDVGFSTNMGYYAIR